MQLGSSELRQAVLVIAYTGSVVWRLLWQDNGKLYSFGLQLKVGAFFDQTAAAKYLHSLHSPLPVSPGIAAALAGEIAETTTVMTGLPAGSGLWRNDD